MHDLGTNLKCPPDQKTATEKWYHQARLKQKARPEAAVTVGEMTPIKVLETAILHEENNQWLLVAPWRYKLTERCAMNKQGEFKVNMKTCLGQRPWLPEKDYFKKKL